MTFSDSHKDYSLHGLEEYAESLIQKNTERERSSRSSVCIAVAGGGSHAISTLAATPGASSILLEGTLTYDRRSYNNYVGLPSNVTGFSYSSRAAAAQASEAALKRALSFRSYETSLMSNCIGIGSASALVSSSSPDSVKGYGHIVATRSDGVQLALNVTLADRQGTENRSRKEEDVFIGHLILRCIELMHQSSDQSIDTKNAIQTDFGDSIVVEWMTPPPETDGKMDVAVKAANRILDDKEEAVVLLPVYKEGVPVSFRALKYPVLPNGSLIFPGSFNPPHVGHISLAQAAVRKAVESGYSKRHSHEPIFFELSITNADKPAIDPATVSERVHKFLDLEGLPEQWGLVLTRAPLFSQKMESLKSCVAKNADNPVSKISFVVGADTLVRIVDPKYYNDNVEEMIDALRSMEGVHFFGGGRLEQKKESEESVRFITGIQELEGLPEDVQAMFTVIDEKEFRVDISSTVLRQQVSTGSTT